MCTIPGTWSSPLSVFVFVDVVGRPFAIEEEGPPLGGVHGLVGTYRDGRSPIMSEWEVHRDSASGCAFASSLRSLRQLGLFADGRQPVVLVRLVIVLSTCALLVVAT